MKPTISVALHQGGIQLTWKAGIEHEFWCPGQIHELSKFCSRDQKIQNFYLTPRISTNYHISRYIFFVSSCQVKTLTVENYHNNATVLVVIAAIVRNCHRSCYSYTKSLWLCWYSRKLSELSLWPKLWELSWEMVTIVNMGAGDDHKFWPWEISQMLLRYWEIIDEIPDRGNSLRLCYDFGCSLGRDKLLRKFLRPWEIITDVTMTSKINMDII